ncbi:DEAD/DEAH box helicase family protein [Companilactobacillus mishanensis]|uniref:DEAD/DEAH box helicase family protein n=1 Tax=Companilactobacillus mishanensis TaxID=2486008 RepID=UPI000F7B6A57|nr:DEAD/DEAH box helicase family protein [Companilactobacillus mishanensis]
MGRFNFQSGTNFEYASPQSMYSDYKQKKIRGILDYQANILDQYIKTKNENRDVTLELPTGSGKTLVALILGEYLRRKNQQKVVYVCLNNLLVEQVAREAEEKYGINCHTFVGKFSEYKDDEFMDYNNAESIAITSYSVIFNKYSRFKDANVLFFDDAHNASPYVISNWTLKIEKSSYQGLFEELVDILKNTINTDTYSHLMGTIRPDPHWVDMLPLPSFDKVASKLLGTISASNEITNNSANHFALDNIQDHFSACNLFMNEHSIEISPQIAPCDTIASFHNAERRIYLSATIGQSGEIERTFGIHDATQIKLNPDEIPRIGRRMFVFPNLKWSKLNTQEELFNNLHLENKRSVALVKSKKEENHLQTILEKNNPSLTSFDGLKLQKNIRDFAVKENVIAILANRYDGIDFPDNMSHLLLLKDLPRYKNLQEIFFSSKLKAAPLLDEALKNKITQAVGRCTRGTNDFSVVVVEGRDLESILSDINKRKLFSPELQAEISIGMQVSTQADDFNDLIGISKDLMNPKSKIWYEVNEGIIELRNKKLNDIKDDADTLILKKISKNEVKFQYCLWNGATKKAYEISKSIILDLKKCQNETLEGLQMYWRYLNIAMLYRIENNHFKGNLITQQINNLLEDSYLLPWFKSLQYSFNVNETQSIDSFNDLRIADMINNIEKNISSSDYGSNSSSRSKAFEKQCAEITSGLSLSNYDQQEKVKDRGIKFEKALTNLGNVLGFLTKNSTNSAAPDPWFYLDGGTIVVSEVKLYANYKPIPVKHIRESRDHPQWLAKNEIVSSTRIINVLISNTLSIEPSAKQLVSSSIKYINTEQLQKFAKLALSTIKEINELYTTEGDISWNKKASSIISNSVINPASLEEKIKNLPLVKNLSTGSN